MRQTEPTVRRGVARTALAAALLLALVGASGAAAVEVEERFDQTYPLAAGGEVSVKNVNGSIHVATWGRDEVRVEATKKAKASSRDAAEEALRLTEIEVDAGSGSVRVETDLPSSSDGILDWVFGRHTNASVSYRITVPREADVEVRTTNGSLEVREVAGRVEARSTNGAIKVAGVRGTVDAATTNGGIAVELAELEPGRGMKFSSTNGGIRVTVPRSARVSVDARTTNGGISLDDLDADIVAKSRRKLQADVNGGGPEITVRTTNGGIRIGGG